MLRKYNGWSDFSISKLVVNVIDLFLTFISEISALSKSVSIPLHLDGARYTFSIHQNSAWVKHDEVSISKEGVRAYSKEIRVLEKKTDSLYL